MSVEADSALAELAVLTPSVTVPPVCEDVDGADAPVLAIDAPLVPMVTPPNPPVVWFDTPKNE